MTAEQQLAALRVGKRADALEPTRRVFALKHQLLVVRSRLADIFIKVQNAVRIPKSAPRRKAYFQESDCSYYHMRNHNAPWQSIEYLICM